MSEGISKEVLLGGLFRHLSDRFEAHKMDSFECPIVSKLILKLKPCRDAKKTISKKIKTKTIRKKVNLGEKTFRKTGGVYFQRQKQFKAPESRRCNCSDLRKDLGQEKFCGVEGECPVVQTIFFSGLTNENKY